MQCQCNYNAMWMQCKSKKMQSFNVKALLMQYECNANANAMPMQCKWNANAMSMQC